MGGTGILCNVKELQALPPCDYVIIHSALYQFHSNEKQILDMAFSAARQGIIVAERVKSMAHSKNPILRFIGQNMTNPGTGKSAQEFLYDMASLEVVLQMYENIILESRSSANGQEWIYLLDSTKN